MSKQVLYIINDEEKKEDIQTLCKELSIEAIEIGPKDINKSLGALLGMPLLNNGGPEKSIPAPTIFMPPELLVFNNMAKEDLDTFLEKYDALDLENIKLKGTVTPFNITWSVYQLIREYQREAR